MHQSQLNHKRNDELTDLINGSTRLTSLGVKDLRDGVGGVAELLEEVGGDGKEVNTSECLDFTNL